MQLTLPNEILSDILRLATSSSDAVDKGNKKLLMRCCLVSKQFCRVAQPMLWRVYVVTPYNHNFFPLLAFPRLASYMHVLVFSNLGHRTERSALLGHGGDQIYGRIRTLPSLVKVSINGGYIASASRAASLQNLTHLYLHDTSLPNLASVTFSHLLSLMLHKIRSVPNTQTPLLPGSCFPSLKALYVRGFPPNDRWNNVPFVEPASVPPGQLDVYQVNADDLDILPPDLHNRGTTLLLTFDWHSAKALTATSDVGVYQHIALTPITSSSAYMLNVYLSNIAVLVRRSTTLKSLSLPLANSPVPLLFYDHEDIRKLDVVRDQLLQLCMNRKIDIIWHDPKTTDDSVGVSRGFWEYAKELKRKKQLAAEEGSG